MEPDQDDAVGENAAVIAEPSNPLCRPLDAIQIELLDLICRPLSIVPGPWPVWDYVSRELGRARQEPVDAGAVLRSLPTLATPRSHSQPYGLAWQSEPYGDEPLREHRVGLTVAGLCQLATVRPQVKEYADAIVSIIAWLADCERLLVSDPDKPVIQMEPLTRIEDFRPRGRNNLHALFSTDVVIDILQKEYVTIAVNNRSDPSTELGPWLRPLRGIESAEAYLALIAKSHASQRPAPRLRGDELALMLDYASYVVASRKDWDAGHLIVAPDLRTAASLTASVKDESQFNDRMSDLKTILDRMNVPFGNSKSGSLVRLKEWLADHVDDPVGKSQAIDAVEDIRSALALRNYAQHPSIETRKNVSNALARLDIPDPIRDWDQAWEIVRARIADAFDVIQREARP